MQCDQLIFFLRCCNISVPNFQEERKMADRYGSDFIVITDENGTEYELEVLFSLDYNGSSYIAAIPADEDMEPEVMILKSEEADGEPILCTIEDESELEAVNALIMDALFQDTETE